FLVIVEHTGFQTVVWQPPTEENLLKVQICAVEQPLQELAAEHLERPLDGFGTAVSNREARIMSRVNRNHALQHHRLLATRQAMYGVHRGVGSSAGAKDVPLLCVYDPKWYWQVTLDDARGEQPQRVPRGITVNACRAVKQQSCPDWTPDWAPELNNVWKAAMAGPWSSTAKARVSPKLVA
ncbi:MAG: hypothetical protein ACKPKO_60330, partial [Candidatus Fonsibacter sp.]